MTKMNRRLFITEPHGAQEVVLISDDPKPGNRIFEIKERNHTHRVGMTGEEIESLCRWWQEYKDQDGQSP